jgi:integrase
MAQYTKRKDGRYQTRIYMGLDENRKKTYKFIYASSIPELKKAEAAIRAKLDKGIDVASLNDSFSQWYNRLKKVKKAELTDNEYKTFCFRVEYFERHIGSVSLNEITQQLLQPYIIDLYTENPSTGKLSSKRTIERYISAISAVFEYAVENRVTDFNPCKYLKIPKQAKTTERRALSPTERKWIEDTPHRAQTAAMLLMYSGLRRGEATALLWSDIDFNNNTITVNKSFDFKSSEIKPPKTTSGIRVVSVPKKLIEYLKGIEHNSIYVLTTAEGRMMTDTAWKRLWDSYLCDLNLKYGKSTIKRNKFHPEGNVLVIEPFTPHCLRHTFCTIMYEAGIDALTAKEQMGHSDIKTTLAIYTHLNSLHKKKNIDKMNDYISSVNVV